MGSWEYLVVIAEEAYYALWTRSVVRPRYINDEELTDWKNGPTLYEFCNQLGAEGWELVSAHYAPSPTTALNTTRLFFKRSRG